MRSSQCSNSFKGGRRRASSLESIRPSLFVWPREALRTRGLSVRSAVAQVTPGRVASHLTWQITPHRERTARVPHRYQTPPIGRGRMANDVHAMARCHARAMDGSSTATVSDEYNDDEAALRPVPRAWLRPAGPWGRRTRRLRHQWVTTKNPHRI